MRNIIKEVLEDFKFKSKKRMILSLLNETILPKYKWVCKFGVESIPYLGEDSIMIVIYLKPIWGTNMSEDNRYKLIDDIWAQVYEWVGIATYERFVNLEHCEKENITESRRDNVITNYLNEIFDIRDINWSHPIELDDETGEEFEDTLRTKFYYGSEFDDNVVFRYYDKGYFRTGSEADIESPILSVDSEYSTGLNGYFGDTWYEPMKRWFKENFGLEVKTIDYL
jgi:hypothetical protein